MLTLAQLLMFKNKEPLKLNETVSQISDRQLAHTKRIRALALQLQDEKTYKKYEEAFAGELRTVQKLQAIWDYKFTRSGIAQQLRKYEKKGIVKIATRNSSTNQFVWTWIGKQK